MLQIWKLVRYGLFLKQYLIRWRNDFSMSLQLDLSSTRTMDIKPMLDSSMMMEFQWLPIKEQRSFWLSANYCSIYIPEYTCTLVLLLFILCLFTEQQTYQHLEDALLMRCKPVSLWLVRLHRSALLRPILSSVLIACLLSSSKINCLSWEAGILLLIFILWNHFSKFCFSTVCTVFLLVLLYLEY